MKRALLIAVLVVAALCVVTFFSIDDRSRKGPRTVSRITLDSLINVHGSPEEGLEVCGELFRHVKGGPPYYINVPDTDYVLFAYEPSSGRKTLVLCDTNICKISEIPLEGVRFGERIGYWAATDGKLGDTIESVQSNRISLLSKSFRYVERSILDLSSNTITVTELKSDFVPQQFNLWSNSPMVSNEASLGGNVVTP